MKRVLGLIVLVACSSQREQARTQATCDARTALVFTIAGTQFCEDHAAILGHGIGDDGRIDIGTDLLFDRGADRQPRRHLDTYPVDRPFGVTLSPQFKVSTLQYTLFFGIGGRRKPEWVAPLTEQVLPGELAYTFAQDPARRGAYVQLSKQQLDADGIATKSGTYVGRSGTVSFRVLDLDRGRYAGSVDLVFARAGALAPADGPDVVEVKGDFDLGADD